MKQVISILSLLFIVGFIYAQPRLNIKYQIQKCLDGSGNPILGCWIYTDALGQQKYITTQQALDSLLNNGLRDTIIAYGGGVFNGTGEVAYVSKDGVFVGATIGNEHLNFPLPTYTLGTFPAVDLVFGYPGLYTWGTDIAYATTPFQDHLLNKPNINNFYFEKGTSHVLGNFGTGTLHDNYISDGASGSRAWAYKVDLDYRNEGELINNISSGSQRVAFNITKDSSEATIYLNKFTATQGVSELLNVQNDIFRTDLTVNDIYTTGTDGLVRLRPSTGRHHFKFNTIDWHNTTSSGAFDVLFRHSWSTGENPNNLDITIDGGDVSVDGTRGGVGVH